MARKKGTDDVVVCEHPVDARVWVGGELICTECKTVLKKADPAPAEEPATEEDNPFGDDTENVATDTGEILNPDAQIATETACCEEGMVTQGGVTNSFTRGLPVMVTPIEMGQFSVEQAELYLKLRRLEDDKKESAKFFKEQIDRIEARLKEVAQIVTEGTVEVPIECQWQYDYEHGIKKLIRLDTHTTVDEKTLTPEEYQMDLASVAQESIEAVEEAFGIQEEVANTDFLPIPPLESTPVVGVVSDSVYLCECGICGNQEEVVPGSNCEICGDGIMEPMQVDEPPVEEPT